MYTFKCDAKEQNYNMYVWEKKKKEEKTGSYTL